LPQLVVNIGAMPLPLENGALEVACSMQDRIRFADHVGQEVLIAATPRRGAKPALVGKAVLQRFSLQTTSCFAVLSAFDPFPSEKTLARGPERAVFWLSEDDDMFFAQTDTASQHTGLDEAQTQFVALDIYGEIARQVRIDSENRCSFSGEAVTLGEGMATPIVPLDSGGKVHARNFIFLHDEPAQLFNQFAWTIGPDLEIIADASAMGTSVLATVNTSGRLVVGDDQGQWPDERALAWHRQKFLDRLR
jgi:hypothetical protein